MLRKGKSGGKESVVRRMGGEKKRKSKSLQKRPKKVEKKEGDTPTAQNADKLRGKTLNNREPGQGGGKNHEGLLTSSNF